MALFNAGVGLHSNGDYKEALQHYNKIFDLLPLDKSGNLSRSNVTKESVWFNSFFVAYDTKDYELAKNYLQKSIDVAYQEPKDIFVHGKHLQEQENLDKALEYIPWEEGVEYDVDLIIAELGII